MISSTDIYCINKHYSQIQAEFKTSQLKPVNLKSATEKLSSEIQKELKKLTKQSLDLCNLELLLNLYSHVTRLKLP